MAEEYSVGWVGYIPSMYIVMEIVVKVQETSSICYLVLCWHLVSRKQFLCIYMYLVRRLHVFYFCIDLFVCLHVHVVF